jgi:hypothetical protein
MTTHTFRWNELCYFLTDMEYKTEPTGWDVRRRINKLIKAGKAERIVEDKKVYYRFKMPSKNGRMKWT